jgi:hypothetical protein
VPDGDGQAVTFVYYEEKSNRRSAPAAQTIIAVAANPIYAGDRANDGAIRSRWKRVMPSSFLLPTCRFCDGPLTLSRIGPRIDKLEQRLFRCSECSAEQELSPPRLVVTNSVALRR